MNPPKPEARIAAQERYTLHLAGRIEELAQDTDESLRSLQQDIKQLSEHVDLGFKQAHAFIQENIATKEDLNQLRSDMAAMESHINANIATMKEDLLDAIKQLWQQKPEGGR
jgi:methyl-accepting chemotaxis protein